MRFILYDRRDHSRQVTVDVLTWRATLAVLHQSEVLTKVQANNLMWRLGGTGSSVGEHEAELIAEHLTTYVLPYLKRGHVVSVLPEDFEFENVTHGTIGLEVRRRRHLVHLSRDWLVSLAQLCAGSAGLGAVSENARAEWSKRTPDQTTSSE